MEQPKYINEDPEFNIKKELASWVAIVSLLFRHWKQIFIAALIGGLLGFVYFF